MEHSSSISFLAFLTLIFAGLGHAIKELHANGTLHYIFVTAQGLMYLASFAAGVITVIRFIKHGHKQSF